MNDPLAVLSVVSIFGSILFGLLAAFGSFVAGKMGKMSEAARLDRLALNAFKVAGICFIGGWFLVLIARILSGEEGTDAFPKLMALFGFCLYIWLAHTVASAARRKGRSYETFLVLSLLALVIVAIVVAAMRPDHLAEGDFAQAVARFETDEGEWVEAGHRSKVLESDLNGYGDPILLINLTDDSTTWVSRDCLRKI